MRILRDGEVFYRKRRTIARAGCGPLRLGPINGPACNYGQLPPRGDTARGGSRPFAPGDPWRPVNYRVCRFAWVPELSTEQCTS
jgi:hypothetical protein